MEKNFIEKIKQNYSEDKDYQSEGFLKEYLDCFCFGSEEDDALFEIQKVYGNERYMTGKQVHESLNRMCKTREGKERLKNLTLTKD